MGKMKIGSAGSSEVAQAPVIKPEPLVSESISNVVEVPKPVIKEVEQVVEIPKIKEVVVEIPKPVYTIKEVEHVVQKPKIKVEEIPQVIVKPVFNVKQELHVLDQLQIKLEESVALAQSKVEEINGISAKKVELDERTLSKLEAETKLLKQGLGVVIALSIISIVLSVVM